ncbi:MAG: hypothetical protein ACQGVK_03645 [Myxococcota bacterium]
MVLVPMLLWAGATRAAKVDLAGVSVDATGSWKMKFKDGSSTQKCGPTARAVGMQFFENGSWTGYVGADFVGGTWKQKGKKDRTLKVELDGPSQSVLNQEIDDGVSSCILSIPDGKPVKIKALKIQGSIDKSGTKLKVKLQVEFRSKEDGFLWDMRGDSKDTFTLKAKFDLPAPASAIAGAGVGAIGRNEP